MHAHKTHSSPAAALQSKYKHHVAKLLSQYERLDASSDPRPKALNPGKQD
jgi:hypothetical protein